jgi:hypothetical protein
MDEALCTAMWNGLGMNETLERLELTHVSMCDENTDLWCRAFSFLRINKALESVAVDMERSPVLCRYGRHEGDETLESETNRRDHNKIMNNDIDTNNNNK